MKNILIFILLFLFIFFFKVNAKGFDGNLTNLHSELFGILSPKVKVENESINNFNKLIEKYIKQGKEEFGSSSLYYLNDIAISNASLAVGYAFKRKTVSPSDINFIRDKYSILYLPLFSHVLPPGMVVKYPDYVLDSKIIPVYGRLVSFNEIKVSYFEILELAKIEPQFQLLVLQSLTGFIAGIALANEKGTINPADIATAKGISCDEYPCCGRMLGKNLFDFLMRYRPQIRNQYYRDSYE